MPFIGIYSTPKHPSALVFEFADHLNLREYLRNNRDVGRLDLVGLHPIVSAAHRPNVLGVAAGYSTWCRTHAQNGCRPREPQDCAFLPLCINPSVTF